MYGELERATGAWTRDELMVLLRDLVREYVIERGLPTGTPEQAATPDLAALDFPRLVTWLKRNLSLPELDLFTVEGQRVIVDADGPRALTVGRPAAPAAPQPSRGSATPAPVSETQPEPETETESDSAADARSRRKLSKGFRGLEFD